MLERLSVEGFRNLATQRFEPGPGHHLLLGENGSGKTSLLEALYVVATTRSFRAANLQDCCRVGGASFAVSADVDTAQRAHLDVRWQSRTRRRSVNGKSTTLAEHLAVLPILAWTAAETELLTGPPSVRRRFLDRGLVGSRPAAIDVLTRYRQALEQKRVLLSERGSDIESWNDLLASIGSELVSLRAAYLARLVVIFRELLAQIGSRFADVDLTYKPSPAEALDGATAFASRLARSEATERERRLPLLGPHRDEIVLTWKGREARRVASAGERKSLGLALLAAQALVATDSGRSPLVILDDADAELDPVALRQTWMALDGASQVLASSARPEVWGGFSDLRLWQLDKGVLRPG